MKKIAYILILAMLLAGCERRPLLDQCNTHYVRIYLDENLKNVTHGFYNESYTKPQYDKPDVLRLILADPNTGETCAERFLRDIGHDSRGTYYEGWIIVEPGTYTLMAYNFDTESTVITNSNNCLHAKASTNPIAAHISANIPSRNEVNKDKKIVYDPDHLFAANCGEVTVPLTAETDTLTTPNGNYFTACSIVKSYYLQVHVKGLEFASSSIGLLSGMSGSSWVNGTGMIEDPVTIYFEMLPGISTSSGRVKTNEDGITTIYTTFNTFGKLHSQQNELSITFDFLTLYGDPYSETLNITDLFSSKEALENQWLLLEHTIVIPEPPKIDGDGGFKPSVDDWGDIETDIII